jgi:transcriptional regulator with XRE-family HTH domain
MEELTRIRNERGWSQQRLADESGVNKATINQIERGRRSPNVETLEKLADALGAEVADFFPKAQAPLPLDFADSGAITELLRREVVYGPWLEFVNRYADRWEQRITHGTLDLGAVNEFVGTLEDLGKTLSMLGLREKQEQPPEYPYSFGPVMGEAIERLMGLLDPLIEAGTKQFEESEISQLRRQREELADQQDRAASG